VSRGGQREEDDRKKPTPRDPGHCADRFPVVAIGASAGGLAAFGRLLDALPPDSGMAFILVQHLDPTHESMMVELLSGHTAMTVRQAAEGMRLVRDQVYVIPPGYFLSVRDAALHLSLPQERHGARLPFDFLLRSLAADLGERAIGAVLSGTGTDGSLGLRAIKEQGGLVIAQEPGEAAYDGMPRSAIATGVVDLVLPVAEIAERLVDYGRRIVAGRSRDAASSPDAVQARMPEIIELLRTRTAHDFSLYKPGTLERRVERRMAMASIATDDIDRYLGLLRSDTAELDLLAEDLLIHVTRFFRDPKVFDFLAETVVPDLVRNAGPDRPLRIWSVGCSTGEEAYSLAMLFLEEIATVRRNVKLQVFASDVDPGAVARAQEGVYPETIETEVSAERLGRFFTKEDRSYRVAPELRATVVFTVQDVLTDPPFSRLDLISCRNLLIYLQPEAQAKVVSLFHFALRDGGILLLGSAETVGGVDSRFDTLSKTHRLHRHLGRSRPGEAGFSMGPGERARVPARTALGQRPSHQGELESLCQRLALEACGPAALLINRKNECVYSLGPTDRYLRLVPGAPSHDVLAMAREGVRTKLRSAMQRAGEEGAQVVVGGGRTGQGGSAHSFRILAEPVSSDGEELLFVCFLDEPRQERKGTRPPAPGEMSRVAELEQELQATRSELHAAIANLEASTEAQKAANEEALSVNEEFQATNEELLTSKEELQSLNEELTALNSQLQETLERQRITANDLQNVLYSTDVATIFLDPNLEIRFFTPATRALFNVIPSDVGRPLSDLSSLTSDDALLEDAREVLRTLAPLEREIETRAGTWYIRRILPYRTRENRVEGVVVTFTDITGRRSATEAVEEARRQAELANAAKSRFLAAASHDLRQPLQTLALLQGVLAATVKGEEAQRLITRFEETLAAMSGMLNALLDINQIEAGTIHAEIVEFPADDLLHRLRDEFGYHAEARGLSLRVVSCGLAIRSDPRLLEQMLRNLLANALKYTERGRLLLGCRRRAGSLRIEVWDTGPGIPEDELQAIFEEYHQIGNAARESGRGLGLGLSIVQRLGDLLGHRVAVRSRPGRGSVFTIEVALAPSGPPPHSPRSPEAGEEAAAPALRLSGELLVVEDDPEVRGLLQHILVDAGHRVTAAADGAAALAAVRSAAARPDLVLADYNLPGGMNGLQLVDELRRELQPSVPVIILTGDISTGTLRDIALRNCLQLNKPVKASQLGQVVQTLLAARRETTRPQVPQPGGTSTGREPRVIFVVDDDPHLREGLRDLLEAEGRAVETYPSCEAFLAAYRPGREGCLLVDAYLPGMKGLELLERLGDLGRRLTAIMITGHGDVAMAVRAMKAGASDFIEKPITARDLLAGVERAFEQSGDAVARSARRDEAAAQLGALTPRQRQIMDLVLAGHPNKSIAADLGISQRTVESHRAAVMTKTGAKSLAELVRLAFVAAEGVDTPRHS